MLDETQSKLDDKSKECKFIGYEGDSIYVVVDASKKKLCSCNVIFIEGTATCTDSTEPKSRNILKRTRVGTLRA